MGGTKQTLFGPIVWNVSMEQFFLHDFPDHVQIQAYADDIAISVAANSRNSFIERAATAL